MEVTMIEEKEYTFEEIHKKKQELIEKILSSKNKNKLNVIRKTVFANNPETVKKILFG